MSNIIDAAMINLIHGEAYYADIILNLNLEISESVPTAGVSINNHMNLTVNPKFWETLSIKEQGAVLKHECLHILNGHIERFINLGLDLKNPTENLQLMNIAADLSINEMIKNLPELACTVEKFREEYPDMKHKKSCEYYYNFLKENGHDSKNGEGNFDDHSGWGDGSVDAEYAKEKVKELVKKALEQTKARGIGNLPLEIQQLIDKLYYNPKNWKADLRKFVAKSSEIFLESNRKVRNRRYGIMFPGHKKHPKMHLAIAVDTSGSVSDKELGQFFAEIDHIHKNNVKVTVIECDCEVGAVYDFDPKKEIKVTGRGGTSYQPAIDEAAKLDTDGLIYFGDMEVFSEELKRPRFPVLWAIVGEGSKKPVDWGSETRIVVKRKA